MSLIVSVLTREGVVMASDSRTTFMSENRTISGIVEKLSIPQSDSTYKTFGCLNRFGVSTCGIANISGLSIGAHVQAFSTQNSVANLDLAGFSDQLGKYFLKLPGCGDVVFHVSGYEQKSGISIPGCRRVIVRGAKGTCIVKEIGGPSVIWDGQIEVLNRLMKAGYIVGSGNSMRLSSITVSQPRPDGTITSQVLRDRIVIPGVAPWKPDINIRCEDFSLQDGIDFAKFAIQLTVDTMRFQAVPKTVGGPIDVLVITLKGLEWIAQKKLH